MRTTRTLVGLVVAIGLTASPATAASGVLIAQKVTSGTTTTTHQSQIEQTRMRSEIVASTGRRQTVVFDGAAQVLADGLADGQRNNRAGNFISCSAGRIIT